MKRSVVLLLMLFAAVSFAGAGVDKSSGKNIPVVDEEAAFSYTIPSGWFIREVQGIKYKLVSDVPRAGYSSNIYIIDEKRDVDLDNYLKISLSTLKRLMKNFKVIEQSSIITNDGMKGRMLRYTNEQKGRMLRQTQYYFAKGSQKYIITCTSAADIDKFLDKVFDQSVRTFKLK